MSLVCGIGMELLPAENKEKQFEFFLFIQMERFRFQNSMNTPSIDIFHIPLLCQ
jgi:hypothetical protein